MQILRPLGVVLLALVAGNHVAALSHRSDTEHKFIKRSPKTVVHHHYHNAPAPAPAPAPASGGGGMFGGGAVKNIAAGTVLAGTGAFAGTIGATEARRLMGGDDHDRDSDDDDHKHQSRQKDAQQNTQPQSQPQGHQPQGQQPQQAQQVPASVAAGQTGRQAYPVAILMSDGSYEPLPNELAAQSAGGARGNAGQGQSQVYEQDAPAAQPRYQPNDAQTQYQNYAAPAGQAEPSPAPGAGAGAGAGTGWGAGAGTGAGAGAGTGAGAATGAGWGAGAGAGAGANTGAGAGSGGFVFPPSNQA